MRCCPCVGGRCGINCFPRQASHGLKLSCCPWYTYQLLELTPPELVTPWGIIKTSPLQNPTQTTNRKHWRLILLLLGSTSLDYRGRRRKWIREHAIRQTELCTLSQCRENLNHTAIRQTESCTSFQCRETLNHTANTKLGDSYFHQEAIILNYGQAELRRRDMECFRHPIHPFSSSFSACSKWSHQQPNIPSPKQKKSCQENFFSLEGGCTKR